MPSWCERVSALLYVALKYAIAFLLVIVESRQLLCLVLLLETIHLLIDWLEYCFGYFLLPSDVNKEKMLSIIARFDVDINSNAPFRNGQWKISINLLILISDFHCFCVVLVEVSNVTSIGSVDFSLWRNERWRVVLLVDLLPINSVEKWMLLDLTRVKNSLFKRKGLNGLPLQLLDHNNLISYQRHVEGVHQGDLSLRHWEIKRIQFHSLHWLNLMLTCMSRAVQPSWWASSDRFHVYLLSCAVGTGCDPSAVCKSCNRNWTNRHNCRSSCLYRELPETCIREFQRLRVVSFCYQMKSDLSLKVQRFCEDETHLKSQAKPRSLILTWPFSSSRMLAGFKSLYTMYL